MATWASCGSPAGYSSVVMRLTSPMANISSRPVTRQKRSVGKRPPRPCRKSVPSNSSGRPVTPAVQMTISEYRVDPSSKVSRLSA
ncbi:hypothetical protein C5O23_05305 [Duncaniella muris]|uniref:Uncharacterized protein n=1 Tax=Duncaniella muris TaxID=2094150 RepID=A0A2V1IP31_9BACT|nr:hypothetical protein C5O23_05305 [Duncaniella muris]